ncbi:MAG TPA: calcium-binding EGF-like domain-containing protein [Kofleriaceae bacterium]|jgi:hypothetical protein
MGTGVVRYVVLVLVLAAGCGGSGATDGACAAGPCQNDGVCTNSGSDYTCACASGYEGINCEVDIDDCVGVTCENGGTCVDGVDSHTCTCAAGYEGTNCEVDSDDCAASPCPAFEICTDRVNGFDCFCDAPTKCTSLAGGEGRCVTGASTIYPAANCAAGARCEPCFDPTAADPTVQTGVCNVGCDAPTQAAVALSCPWLGPAVIEPSVLPSCCSGAHCLPAAYTPENAKPNLATCTGGYCVPDAMISTAGNFLPTSCVPFAGTGEANTQGRCLSSCLPFVAADQSQLEPSTTCGAGKACVSCWDPISGASTGACTMSSCDAAPPTKYRFPDCCAGLGRCLPKTLIPGAEQGSLGARDCPATAGDVYLCVAADALPGGAQKTCTVSGAIIPPNSWTGVCVPDCVIGDTTLIPKANCPTNYSCPPPS